MCSVYRLLSLLKCHTSQEANLAKASLGAAGIKKTAPAEKDRVNEGVQVLPHLRLHPHHVSPFIGCLPSSEDEDHADAIVGDVGGKFSHHHNQHDRES